MDPEIPLAGDDSTAALVTAPETNSTMVVPVWAHAMRAALCASFLMGTVEFGPDCARLVSCLLVFGFIRVNA